MSDQQKLYDTGVPAGQQQEMICTACGQPLQPTQVTLSYMDSSFPVMLPACQACGLVYIPEQLATGRMLSVEKDLEDK